jgi:hypothetical protein
MIKKPEFKIGTRVDIVFENEINSSNAHYLKALVYDYEDDKITISQTSPALNRSFLNRRIMVTFLANAERRILRFGFPARLIDLIPDYQIASKQAVEALVLKQYADPESLDFRMYFRVKTHLQGDINLFFKEEKVNLIDISLGGAKFTCRRDYSFEHNSMAKFKLLIGPSVFDLKTRVCDVVMPYDDSANKNLQYVSIEFEHENKQMETLLGKAIIGIERQLLSEGKL